MTDIYDQHAAAFKHTPGPWRITDDFISVWTDNGADLQDFQVCSLDSEGSPEIDAPTSLANAHLIAAAPELLEALAWIVNCPTIKGPIGTTAYIIGDNAMQKARAAIAKAEGKQA